jgi:hypothetical protein
MLITLFFAFDLLFSEAVYKQFIRAEYFMESIFSLHENALQPVFLDVSSPAG